MYNCNLDKFNLCNTLKRNNGISMDHSGHRCKSKKDEKRSIYEQIGGEKLDKLK